MQNPVWERTTMKSTVNLPMGPQTAKPRSPKEVMVVLEESSSFLRVWMRSIMQWQVRAATAEIMRREVNHPHFMKV